MKIYKKTIEFKTSTQVEFVDITDRIREIIEGSGVREGHVLVFSQHTTMGVAINQNEDMLIQDFMRLLYKLVPVEEQYSHDLFELQKKQSSSDGRSNGHSHCKSILLGNSEVVPIEKGKLMISKMQSIFAVELDGSRDRSILIQVVGM